MRTAIALLATVNYLLSNGEELEQEELLRSKFRTYHQQAKDTLKELALTDVRDLPSWTKLVNKFLGSH